MPLKDIEAKRRYQRKYDKEWYQKNKDKVKDTRAKYYIEHKDRINKHRREVRITKRDRTILFYVEFKYSGTPCMDCNTVYEFCAMDFDHRPNEVKSFGIATKNDLLATPDRISQVEKEISKCDLVCATCHRIRTHVGRTSKEIKYAVAPEYEI